MCWIRARASRSSRLAYLWLGAGHQGSQYLVRTAAGTSAAFRRDGFAGPGDTVEVFRVRHVGGLRAAEFLLRSNVRWLSVPDSVTAGSVETAITVRYAAGSLVAPGVYMGSVTAWNPSDTLAGPLFTLVNTVVVPHDLAAHPLVDEAQGDRPRESAALLPAGAGGGRDVAGHRHPGRFRWDNARPRGCTNPAASRSGMLTKRPSACGIPARRSSSFAARTSCPGCTSWTCLRPRSPWPQRRCAPSSLP